MENILITYVSNMNSRLTKESRTTYTSDLGEIQAILTNEAAVRYLCRYLGNNGRSLNKIYAFCTYEVKESVLDNFNDDVLDELFGKKISETEKTENTTLEYFKRFVKSISPNTEVNDLFVSTDKPAEIIDVMEKINPEDKIFLDITGGLRDAVFNITLLSRFAEFNGNNVEKVIYSLFIPGKNEVRDFTSSFKLMELMNGISEFASFASTDRILKYFENSNNDSIKKLTSTMLKFTDAITLGKSGNIESGLMELRETIEKFEKTTTEDMSEKIFKYLIQLIKGKFFEGQDIDYLSIIEWCLDNKLVQQALTLYTEKIPKYLFEKEIISCSSEQKEKVLKHKKIETEEYYYIFWSDYLVAPSPTEIMKNIFKDENIDVENEKKIKALMKKYENSVPELKIGLSKYLELIRWIKQECVKSNIPYISIKTIRNKKPSPTVNSDLSVVWGEICRQNVYKVRDFGQDKIVNAFLYNNTYAESSFSKKLKFIKNYKNYYKAKTGYSINDPNSMEYICNSYVFFKTIRNEINHASETENFSKKEKRYFKNKGFTTDISVNSIDAPNKS